MPFSFSCMGYVQFNTVGDVVVGYVCYLGLRRKVRENLRMHNLSGVVVGCVRDWHRRCNSAVKRIRGNTDSPESPGTRNWKRPDGSPKRWKGSLTSNTQE